MASCRKAEMIGVGAHLEARCSRKVSASIAYPFFLFFSVAAALSLLCMME